MSPTDVAGALRAANGSRRGFPEELQAAWSQLARSCRAPNAYSRDRAALQKLSQKTVATARDMSSKQLSFCLGGMVKFRMLLHKNVFDAFLEPILRSAPRASQQALASFVNSYSKLPLTPERERLFEGLQGPILRGALRADVQRLAMFVNAYSKLPLTPERERLFEGLLEPILQSFSKADVHELAMFANAYSKMPLTQERERLFEGLLEPILQSAPSAEAARLAMFANAYSKLPLTPLSPTDGGRDLTKSERERLFEGLQRPILRSASRADLRHLAMFANAYSKLPLTPERERLFEGLLQPILQSAPRAGPQHLAMFANAYSKLPLTPERERLFKGLLELILRSAPSADPQHLAMFANAYSKLPLTPERERLFEGLSAQLGLEQLERPIGSTVWDAHLPGREPSENAGGAGRRPLRGA